MSERRDSNPRPRPWEGRALPAELLSLITNCGKIMVSMKLDLPTENFFQLWSSVPFKSSLASSVGLYPVAQQLHMAIDELR